MFLWISCVTVIALTARINGNCNNDCKICETGHFQNSGVCLSCKDNCSECDDFDTCRRCKPGYFLESPDTRTCVQCEDANCRECTKENKCQECNIGYYVDQSESCTPCQDNCFRCTNGTNCLVCNTGFTYNAGTCTKCGYGCNMCTENDKCSVCNEGYYLEKGYCKSCRTACIACLNLTNCTECASGHWGSSCTSLCLHNCSEHKCDKSSGECTKCRDGFYGRDCKTPCPPNCKRGVCYMSGQCAEGCTTGFHGNTCMKIKCPKNCKDEICNEKRECSAGCKAGFYGTFCNRTCIEHGCVNYECYQDTGKCVTRCPTSCLSCKSFRNCTVCKPGTYGNICEYPCSACKDGICAKDGCKFGCKNNDSYADGIACSPCVTKCCPENCASCDSHGHCKSCIDGFYGAKCENICMDVCRTCTDGNRCTECGANNFDSNVEPGQCSCDKRQCSKMTNNISCFECRNKTGWYAYKMGCCTCSKHCKNPRECGLNGNCKGGCAPGWWGMLCGYKCPVGNCLSCTDGHCHQCIEGFYGDNCQYNCNSNCLMAKEQGQDQCERQSGRCVHGCKNETWGLACEHNCWDGCLDKLCNSSSGHCFECTRATLYGPLCNQERIVEPDKPSAKFSLPLVLGLSLLGVLVIGIAVVVFIRRRSATRKLATENATNEQEMNVVRSHSVADDNYSITENMMYIPFEPSQRSADSRQSDVMTENQMYIPYNPIQQGNAETNMTENQMYIPYNPIQQVNSKTMNRT